MIFAMDSRTLVLSNSMVIGVMIVASFLFVLIYRKRYQGIQFWFYSNVLWALGFFFMSYQTIWHSFLTVVISNFLIILSLSFLNISFCSLVGKKANYLFNFVIAGIVLVLFIFLEDKSLLTRIVTFSVGAILILGKTGIDLAADRYEYKNNYFIGTGLLAFIVVIAFVIRIATSIYSPEDIKYLIQAGNSANIFFILMMLMKICFNIAYILLISSMTVADINASLSEISRMNSSKDKFFSIISHDMKNLFSGLLWLSENLLQNIQEEKFDPKADLIRVRTLNEAIQRQYSLLENLLLWARAQTNKLDYKPEIIDLKQLSQETVSLYEELASKKEIKINSEITKSIFIFADKEMVSTVIRNILNNAIKFTKKSGKVKLYFFEKPEADMIELIVEDNGIGIPSENLNRLFQIDQKLTSKGTNNEIGTGLGLIVCKEFIEKNGGYIQAESEVGVGSKFKITFNKIKTQSAKQDPA